MEFGAPLLDRSRVGSCQALRFVSDRAGWKRLNNFEDGNYSRKDFSIARLMHQAINKRAREVNKSITVSSTYLIATKDSLETVKILLDKGIDITLMTNSLMSSDGPLVSSKLYLEAPMWVEKGIKLFLHSGKMPEGIDPINEKIAKARWGTHAKTMVFDDNSFVISSFNMDNRSRFYNTEAGIFCENSPSLTKQLLDDMKIRQNNSILMIEKDKAITVDGTPIDIYAGASQEKIDEMKSKDKKVKIGVIEAQL
jgi:putative cardiolipin synthase